MRGIRSGLVIESVRVVWMRIPEEWWRASSVVMSDIKLPGMIPDISRKRSKLVKVTNFVYLIV